MTPKTKAPNRAQFDKSLADFETESVKLSRLEADQQREQKKLSEKYAKPIAEAKAAIETAKTIAESYVEACHAELLPEGKKSVMIGQVHVGMRAARPSLTLCDGCNWDDVTKAIQKKFPSFVRVVPELQKEKLKIFLQEDTTKAAEVKKVEACGVKLKTGTDYFVTFKPAA